MELGKRCYALLQGSRGPIHSQAGAVALPGGGVRVITHRSGCGRGPGPIAGLATVYDPLWDVPLDATCHKGCLGA